MNDFWVTPNHFLKSDLNYIQAGINRWYQNCHWILRTWKVEVERPPENHVVLLQQIVLLYCLVNCVFGGQVQHPVPFWKSAAHSDYPDQQNDAVDKVGVMCGLGPASLGFIQTFLQFYARLLPKACLILGIHNICLQSAPQCSSWDMVEQS